MYGYARHNTIEMDKTNFQKYTCKRFPYCIVYTYDSHRRRATKNAGISDSTIHKSHYTQNLVSIT